MTGKIIGEIILIAAAVALICYEADRLRREEEKSRALSSRLEELEAWQAELKEQALLARKYRHDLAKHLATLRTLAKQGENGSGTVLYSEDAIVEAVCIRKAAECRERGIAFSCDARGIGRRKVSDIDLAGLLMNLLDNAVEANQRLPEGPPRFLACTVCRRGRTLTVVTENPLPKPGEFSLKTWKADEDEHGLGTAIIGEIVRSYQGRVSYRVSEDGRKLTVEAELEDA